MPARRAFAPWGIPLHLPRFARGRLAPNGKVGGVAFAIDFVDPRFAIFGDGAGQAAIFWNGRNIEIQTAVEYVAMRVGYAFAPFNHCVDIFGRFGVRGLADVQPFQIGLKIRLVKGGDIPCGLSLRCRRFLHLVIARVGVAGQMANIGDVDDMGELVALVGEHATQRVGKDISAHIADMLVIIHRRPAAIHPRFAVVNGGEGFQLPGQAVEEAQFCHALAMVEMAAEVKVWKYPTHRKSMGRKSVFERYGMDKPFRKTPRRTSAGWCLSRLSVYTNFRRARPKGVIGPSLRWGDGLLDFILPIDLRWGGGPFA